jgi:hypothetical protein
MLISGCKVEGRPTILLQKIDVTARSKELFRDGRMSFTCREVERPAFN